MNIRIVTIVAISALLAWRTMITAGEKKEVASLGALMIRSSYGVALINRTNGDTPRYSISRVPATLYAIGWTMGPIAMVPIGSKTLLRYTYSSLTRYSTGYILAPFLVYTLYKSVVAWRNWHIIHTIVNTNTMGDTIQLVPIVPKNSKPTSPSAPELQLEYTATFPHWWSLSTDLFTPTLKKSS